MTTKANRDAKPVAAPRTVEATPADPFTIIALAPSECAPAVRGQSEAHCSSAANISRMGEWLASHSGARWRLAPAADVVREAQRRTRCETESCLYRHVALDASELASRFVPEGPARGKDWLSNVDIDAVLAQYVARDPAFMHVPYGMRDYAATRTSMAAVSWPAALARRAVACAVNTDLSTGQGIHWCAMYVDMSAGAVEFFDSTGEAPAGEFVKGAIDIAATLTELTGREFAERIVTRVQHQRENNECGVYALYYILSRLHGVPAAAFEHVRVPDSTMQEFRSRLFRDAAQ